MSEGYNGWSNYETWLISLWFGDYFIDSLQYAKRWEADDFASAVDSYLEESGEMGSQTGFVADCVNGILGRVNWHELADHYEEHMEPEDDGQPDEMQEWADFDPDC